MNRYLITGVNGFVGKYIVEYLYRHEPDCEILGIGLSDSTEIKNIMYKSVDLRDAAQTLDAIRTFGPDYIIHLAAVSSVSRSWADPAGCFFNNTAAFVNIAESVRKENLKTRILSVGSSEQYGPYDRPITEDFQLNPTNPYSVARLSQEYMSKMYADGFGLDIVMTRSFNHIGPGQSTNFVIPSFIEQLINISAGKQDNRMLVGNIDVVRDFLDVRDVVDAYYKILKHAKSGAIYNVCSGNGVRLRDIIDIVSDKLGIHPDIVTDTARLRANDTMSVIGDNNKLKSELGWEPKYTLTQTIQDIIDNLRGNK